MPSGHFHTQMTVYAAVITSTAIVLTGEARGFIWGLGMLSGVFLTPDLDVEKGNYGIYIIRKNFGEIVAIIWQIYWRPYAKLFSHRGRSHWILIGTLSRVIYSTPFNPTMLLIMFPDLWSYYLIWFMGLVFSDALHIITDRIVTKVKRKYREDYRL